MVKGIAEILKEASSYKRSRNEKIEYLKANDNQGIRTVIRLAFDTRVEWELPPGSPPYTPNVFVDQEGSFYKELRKLYIFQKGGAPNVPQIKRENLFIQLLESLDPADAKLMIAIKDKQWPYYSLNIGLLKEAFDDVVDINFLPKEIQENAEKLGLNKRRHFTPEHKKKLRESAVAKHQQKKAAAEKQEQQVA